MAVRDLFVIEHEQTNLRLFESFFGEAGFRVRTADCNEEALKILSTLSFDVVLCELSAPRIDGLGILRELQRNPLHGKCSIIFLTSKNDVWSRLACLRLGAEDVLVKPMHAREIVARVGMILRRSRRYRAEADPELCFSGRLEDYSLIELIESLGVERRSGILTVINENGSLGRLAFRDGRLIAAETAFLRAEEAVYKLMGWRNGVFTMLFGETDAEDEMTLSNMGILFQGVKRMDLRSELLKQLPSLDSVVITTSNFRQIIAQKDTNPELREFLTLFDGERTLGRIIDECRENEIIALKRIVKLYKLGFLHVLRDFGDEQGENQVKQEHEEDGDVFFDFHLEEKNKDTFVTAGQPVSPLLPQQEPIATAPGPQSALFTIPVEETETPKVRAEQLGCILVIGSNEEKARRVVETMTQQPLATEKVGMLDFRYSTLNFIGGAYLTVFCLSTNKEFSPLVDYAANELAGIVVALDKNSTRWDYYRYLLHALHRVTNAPIHVLFFTGERGGAELETVRKKLNAPAWVSVHVQSAFEPEVLRRLLFLLLKKHRSDAAKFVAEEVDDIFE